MEGEEKKLCRLCAAANDADAVYCKHCGTPFGAPEKTNIPTAALDQLEDIPIGDAAVFIGRGASRYIPKFVDMDSRRSRMGWNWPVLLLALFLGPAAMAIWFFYRKMYRPAWAFLSAGLLILLGNTLLNFDFNVQFYSLLIGNIHDLALRALSPADFLEFLVHTSPAAANGSVSYVLHAMLWVLVLAYKLAAAVFANGIYKRHVVRCIRACPEGANRAERLRTMGGVSIPWAVIAIFTVLSAYGAAGAAPVLRALGIL